MNEFLTALLIGLGSGIVVFPIFLGIYLMITNTLERRRIKRMIKKGRFLIPIDVKDYDVKAWQNQRYGNIDPEEHKKDLAQLNVKIFTKTNGN